MPLYAMISAHFRGDSTFFCCYPTHMAMAGSQELVLLVEATNFQARGVYERLNYRLAGLRLAEAGHKVGWLGSPF